MNRRSQILLAAGIAAALLRPAPTVLAPANFGVGLREAQVDQENPPEDPPGLLGVRARLRRKLTEGLPGNWQLTRFDHVVNDLSNAPVYGYMTIEKVGYLTLIVHAREPEPNLFDGGLRVQAGVHHWRLTDDGVLQTSSILAHSNFSSQLELEAVYTPREYAVSLEGDILILRRPDGSELTFERLQAAVFPEEAARRIDQIREFRDG
ncbi:hypothetical protein [Engelhardtia mirabilis]|uniref:THAP4-like heme-binding beta-barrel domain-containing protein n=1 Tax=Engelhardtia mirabilis TaxID=2528011 RepID=A0A518BT09_9BACT|nr:hypothetical protein Pla133_52180 [Planctomycetes bacterium Pla133]QDV04420.1 hypothetical protein Pla86_52150 [Planctomycetes bacterium Pla86]